MLVAFKTIDDDAKYLPKQAKPGDAGFDACAAEDVVLQQEDTKLVSLGFSMEFPEGHAAFLMPRSGFSSKNQIIFLNSVGLIDSGYRGIVKAALQNIGQREVRIKKGDRIAQVVFVPLADVVASHVETLSESVRGEGGFGHTGR